MVKGVARLMQGVDRLCARLNAGPTAVAVALAVAVVAQLASQAGAMLDQSQQNLPSGCDGWIFVEPAVN